MSKLLLVEFQDGTVWQIPASFVADVRAKYYEEYDGEDGDYQKEYDLAMEDDYLIVDWATNNMNWEDVEEQSSLYGRIEGDYGEWWCNSRKIVVGRKI